MRSGWATGEGWGNPVLSIRNGERTWTAGRLPGAWAGVVCVNRALHCRPMFALFTALLGGLLVGAAASLLLWGAGHAAGVSGIAAGLWPARAGGLAVAGGVRRGLVAGGLVLRWLAPERLGAPPGELRPARGGGGARRVRGAAVGRVHQRAWHLRAGAAVGAVAGGGVVFMSRALAVALVRHGRGAVKRLVPFAAGLLFALGLGLSGMTLPAKVIGFLDVLGALGSQPGARHGRRRCWCTCRSCSGCGGPSRRGPGARAVRARRAPGAGGGAVRRGLGAVGLVPGAGHRVAGGGRSGVVVFTAAMFAGLALAGLRRPQARTALVGCDVA